MSYFSSQNQLSEVAQKAFADISAHIERFQPTYSRWYAGIATDPRQRLFSDHNVSEADGVWIYRDAGSESGARDVERRLLINGCQGGTGGGIMPKSVYAYLITQATRE